MRPSGSSARDRSGRRRPPGRTSSRARRGWPTMPTRGSGRTFRTTSRSSRRPDRATATAATCSSSGVDALNIEATRRRLEAAGGGYEVVHTSPGLEIGVYVLVAPEPDRQQPHVDDEVYVVLDGRGVLEVEGATVEVGQGQAAFVPAGADHRFTGYEGLSVLVVFSRPHEAV